MAKRRKSSTTKTVMYGKNMVSPQGIAMWSYLAEPAEAADGMKEKFKVSLFFDSDDPAFKKFEKLLSAANEEHGSTEDSTLKMADEYCVEYAKEKNIEGIYESMPYVAFTTGKGPIPIVDATGEKTEEDIWAGDIARVQYNMCGWYFGKKSGVSCWLSGAQLIKTSRKALLSTTELGGVVEEEFDGDSASLDELLAD